MYLRGSSAPSTREIVKVGPCRGGRRNSSVSKSNRNEGIYPNNKYVDRQRQVEIMKRVRRSRR